MQCWHAASKTWIHEQSSSKTASISAALKLGNLLNRASSRQQPNMTTARAKACPRKQAARQEGLAAALMKSCDGRQSMKTRRRAAARRDERRLQRRSVDRGRERADGVRWRQEVAATAAGDAQTARGRREGGHDGRWRRTTARTGAVRRARMDPPQQAPDRGWRRRISPLPTPDDERARRWIRDGRICTATAPMAGRSGGRPGRTARRAVTGG